MPLVAPVAVEPRKIKPRSDPSSGDPAAEIAEQSTAAESDGSEPVDSKLPLIPILAGIIGIVVLGLLIKVLTAK